MIAVLSLILYFVLDRHEEGRPSVRTTIGCQICIALGILLTIYWTKIAGFFLSLSAFTVPFIVLLTTGKLTDLDHLADKKEQTLAVWEWLLFPVGVCLYFFTFFFYWVFRRLRRVFFEKEARRY